jgi:acetyltransferase-like isoleucine patch superfamily enzyme
MANNQYILKKANGEIIDNPNVEGLKVDFFGSNNSIEIDEGGVFHNVHLKLRESCTIIIGKTHSRGLRNTVVDMAGSINSFCKIGSNTSIESCRFAMANDKDISITIGENCMLSSNIVFRATDGHVVYDFITNKISNKTKPIEIGNHVWIGASVTIMKGSKVSDNSVLGTGSILTKKFEQENVVIAGNPAKIVKEGINWDRRHLKDFGDYFNGE